MRFLVDVCVGKKAAAWLRDLGHDVLEIRDFDPCMKDEEVLQWACREKRIVITVDKDFGQLAVAGGRLHHGIIRLPDAPLEVRKRLLARIIAHHAEDLNSGSIITASRTRIRIRRGDG